jgi:hypothetical protein
MSAPRAVWTPSSQQARQENLCTSEELVSSTNNLDTNNSSSSATLYNAGLMSSNASANWWQQQALQVKSLMKQKCKPVATQYTHFPNAFFPILHTRLYLTFFCCAANHAVTVTYSSSTIFPHETLKHKLCLSN